MPTLRALLAAIPLTERFGSRYTEMQTLHRFAQHVEGVELRRWPAAPDVVNPVANR